MWMCIANKNERLTWHWVYWLWVIKMVKYFQSVRRPRTLNLYIISWSVVRKVGVVISLGVLVSSHLSLSSVCERPILFTTSIPPETLPNMVCLPATNKNSAINSGQWWKMFQNIVFTILTIKPASWSKCYEKLTSVGIGTTVYCNVGNVSVFLLLYCMSW